MEPLPALITPAPEPPHAILQKRNITGNLISGLNYIEGWSQVGRTQEPVNPYCNMPGTASFFKKGNQLIQTCVLPGVESDSLDFSTACLDYQTQGYAQMQSGTRYCPQTAPYCDKYLFNAGLSTYTALGCMDRSSITYSYTRTGVGPPYLTSTSASSLGSGSVSITGTTNMIYAPSSTTKALAFSSSLADVTLTTEMTSSPPSTTRTPSASSPLTGINLAAAIFGTLGVVGILVIGTLAIYVPLTRKNRRKQSDNLRDSQKSVGDDIEAEKSLESLSLASKVQSTDQNWVINELVQFRGASNAEFPKRHTEIRAEDEVGTVDSSIRDERGGFEENDEEEEFKWDIKILDAQSKFRSATALLDTQCQIGNWISLRLVQRLDRLISISQNFTPPNISEASGNSVAALGIIELEWKRVPRGNRIHQTKFYVYSTSGEIDVIFGVDYIVKEKLLGVHQNALIPLVEHKKAKKGSKAAIALAEAKHRQEVAEHEARRAASQNAAQSQAQEQQQQQQQQYQDQQQGQQGEHAQW